MFCNSRWVSLRHETYTCGRVPQGAVLSPLLYNIYVADIPTSKPIHMAQFADDTCVFYQCKFNQISKKIKHLQTALNLISDWFASWNIKINATKTEAIVFRKYRREVEAPIKIQNQIIPYNSSVKYLGLTLDSNILNLQIASTRPQRPQGQERRPAPGNLHPPCHHQSSPAWRMGRRQQQASDIWRRQRRHRRRR